MKLSNRKLLNEGVAALPWHVRNGALGNPDTARTLNVIAFIGIMTQRHGDRITDKEEGAGLDWGQALARALFGRKWSANNALLEQPPTEVYGVMDKWLDSEFPRWLGLPWSSDLIKCGQCEGSFDPADLGAVFEHQHSGLPQVKGITGHRVPDA